VTNDPDSVPDLSMYTELIDQFVAGALLAEQFGGEYIRRQKSDQRVLGEPWYRILTDLFIACDDYVADPALRTDPPGSRRRSAPRRGPQRPYAPYRPWRVNSARHWLHQVSP
jgi:hypothetical protein